MIKTTHLGFIVAVRHMLLQSNSFKISENPSCFCLAGMRISTYNTEAMLISHKSVACQLEAGNYFIREVLTLQ